MQHQKGKASCVFQRKRKVFQTPSVGSCGKITANFSANDFAALASRGSSVSDAIAKANCKASASSVDRIIGGKVMAPRNRYPTPRSPWIGRPAAANIAMSRQMVRVDTPSRAAMSPARCSLPSRRVWIRSNKRSVRRMASGSLLVRHLALLCVLSGQLTSSCQQSHPHNQSRPPFCCAIALIRHEASLDVADAWPQRRGILED